MPNITHGTIFREIPLQFFQFIIPRLALERWGWGSSDWPLVHQPVGGASSTSGFSSILEGRFQMFLRRLVLFLFLLVLLDLEILEPPPVRNFPEVNIGFILFWAGLRPLEVVGVEDGGDSFGFASLISVISFVSVRFGILCRCRYSLVVCLFTSGTI